MIFSVLKKGSTGQEVKDLQKVLNCAVDGIFGPITEEAVRQFQEDNGLQVDGIVGPKTLEVLKAQFQGLVAAPARKIDKIIVHCSATPEGEDFTVEDIDGWHKAQGYQCIGYHYVIYRDGIVASGRPEAQVGAHCSGYNTGSIGVCYIGGCVGREEGGQKAKDTRTPEQKASLISLLSYLKMVYPNAKIYGHHDFNSGKACPSFNAKQEYKDL